MHSQPHDSRRRVLACAAALLLAPSAALAGGMAITMQSGAGLGNIFSGGAAAEDASAMFFNPAGLAWLNRAEVVASATWIDYTGGFTNNGSSTGGLFPTTGGNGDGSGSNRVIPTAFAALPISDKLAFGFGVSTPYGLATAYEPTWVGRYHAIKSELQTINLTPAIAWRPVEGIAVGFGFDWQHADAELSNAVDFGLIGFLNGVPDLLPGGADGAVRIQGDDSSTGFNVGVLFELGASGRLGVTYRSKLDHQLAGTATFTSVPAAFAPMFPDQSAAAALTLPEKISVSFYQELTPSLAVMADWSWWNWSRFTTLAVDFANPLTPDSALVQNWNDASIYSAGLRWTQNASLTWRVGAAFNETPVSSPALRSPRIPDSDRVWIGGGATWRFAENMRADFGYAHLFMRDSTTLNDDGLGHVLSGSFSMGVHVLSAQLTCNF